MFAGEAVDEGVGGSQNSLLDLLMCGFGGVGCEAGDFLATGLDEVMEAVGAGIEALAEEGDLTFVALLVSYGH